MIGLFKKRVMRVFYMIQGGRKMKRCIMKKFVVVFAIIASCLSLSGALGAKEEFQARILAGFDPGMDEVRKIKVSIENYSTREEIMGLAGILSTQGFEPFMDAFLKLKKGIALPVGGRGIKINIHIAQSIPEEKGRKILLFSQRQSMDADRQLAIDRRYPFMIIEFNLDEKDKGEGKLYEQANVRFTGLGTIELESYNSPPRQLYDISKKK
jgi:hypothetical protein